jgi:hypothetical protein
MRHVDGRSATKSPRNAATALLLAVALLLCHGALGAQHQAHQQAATGVAGAPHQHAAAHVFTGDHGGVSGLGTGGHAEGQGGECSGCVAYFATLLVAYLGALLGLLLAARYWTSTAVPSPSPLNVALRMHRQARGPTLSGLQVLRL